MSLATLLYPPPTDRGMDEWLFANVQHHRTITDAIASQRGVRIAEQNIWPVGKGDWRNFLRRHQEWHDAINGALGVPGVDLQSLDFNNKQQVDAWIWLHFVSHRAWAQALGLGI